MEYQRIRQIVGTVNTLYSLTSFANPDVDPIWQAIGGGKRPVLHFAPGEEPPVNAFWSVTVYDAAGYLVPNALRHYSVSSSRPDELVRRPDGSIDIVFARRDPGDPGANWLKVPALGRFSAYLRMYWPEQPILDGSWQPPPIARPLPV